mmetsp:Transcript_1704/g.4388  ORF Transcript_1704/g.4388 Transcript_1704/m.4388 type:complete len:180 (+) Transcript_1704:70-609(+)
MAPKFNEKNFPLTVQVRCPTAPPSTSETGLEMVTARGELQPGKKQKDGSYLVDFQVFVKGEELGRPGIPKFSGPYVFGCKMGRFAKLMMKQPGAKSMQGVKILLTHNGTKAAKDTKQWITMDMAAQAYASGGCVFAEVPGPHETTASAAVLGNGWKLERGKSGVLKKPAKASAKPQKKG